EEPGYNPGDMGRPAKTHRTAFGERLFQARSKAGLSQAEVAEKAVDSRETSTEAMAIVTVTCGPTSTTAQDASYFTQ
ncbi:MAG: helix-turn-helix domain-containing protein, partial [Opitutaceae bacterium]